jgi:hypothetical protein
MKCSTPVWQQHYSYDVMMMQNSLNRQGQEPKKKSRFSRQTDNAQYLASPSVVNSFGDDYMAPFAQISSFSSLQSLPTQELSKKRIYELMEQRTEETLNVPISSANKGFQLLRKLGYSGERGLGKDREGIEEPLSIPQREFNDVKGLGLISGKVLKKEEHAQTKLQHVERTQRMQNAFLQGSSSNYAMIKLRKDICSVQKVVYELDSMQGIAVHRLVKSVHDMYAKLSAAGATSHIDEDEREVGEGTKQRWDHGRYGQCSIAFCITIMTSALIGLLAMSLVLRKRKSGSQSNSCETA